MPLGAEMEPKIVKKASKNEKKSTKILPDEKKKNRNARHPTIRFNFFRRPSSNRIEWSGLQERKNEKN